MIRQTAGACRADHARIDLGRCERRADCAQACPVAVFGTEDDYNRMCWALYRRAGCRPSRDRAPTRTRRLVPLAAGLLPATVHLPKLSIKHSRRHGCAGMCVDHRTYGRAMLKSECENAANTDPALRRRIYLVGNAFSAANGGRASREETPPDQSQIPSLYQVVEVNHDRVGVDRVFTLSDCASNHWRKAVMAAVSLRDFKRVSQYSPKITPASKGRISRPWRRSRSNMCAGSNATPAPCAAASAMVSEESNTRPRTFGVGRSTAANQRAHSSTR